MAQQVTDLVLSLLRRGFDPWPGKFCVPRAWPKTNEGEKAPLTETPPYLKKLGVSMTKRAGIPTQKHGH